MSTFDMLARLRPRLAPFAMGAIRISMFASMLTIGVVMAAAFGLRRRNRPEGNGPVRVAIVAGTIGALAMVPVGMVVMSTTGATLNVYGELLVERLLGTVVLPALFVEHLLIGWMAALPLVMGIRHITRAPATIGAVYGAAMWLGVNALALPAAFEKPTPFAIGWTAIWPSLLVHVIYGAVTAAVATRLSPTVEVDTAASLRTASITRVESPLRPRPSGGAPVGVGGDRRENPDLSKNGDSK